MQHSKLTVAAAIAVSAMLGIGVASAADLPVKALPMVAPAFSWTGFYGGGNIGGGWGTRNNVNYSPNDPASANFLVGDFPIARESFKTSGVLGGVQLGYNYQFNRNWLIGLETDFDGTGMKGSTSDAAQRIFSSVEERIDWFGTVRARLGYLPTDNLLAYFTGGFAYGNVERTPSFAIAPGNSTSVANGGFGFRCSALPAASISSTCFAGASRDTATGWTLGGGLEYAFWQRWTVKAEYLYVSLGGKPITEIASSPGPGTTPSSLNASFGHANFNVARVGVNYHF